jgi:hypothetical protein
VTIYRRQCRVGPALPFGIETTVQHSHEKAPLILLRVISSDYKIRRTVVNRATIVSSQVVQIAKARLEFIAGTLEPGIHSSGWKKFPPSNLFSISYPLSIVALLYALTESDVARAVVPMTL